MTALSFTTTCPVCGRPWTVHESRLRTPATRFEDCAFSCEHCGIAFSNATHAEDRVRITRTPELNVPAEARPGLSDALADAMNVRNRKSKRLKFCSARSEDAVTWTVVRALGAAGSLRALASSGVSDGQVRALLLWGHGVLGQDTKELRSRLEELSDKLGENPKSRSEPDVMLWTANGLTVVEAKLGSANDSAPGHPGYPKYLTAPGLFRVDPAEVAAEGSYQLTRNWVIGSALASGLDLPLRLVNLAGPSAAATAKSFGALLASAPDRSFEHRRWRDVLADADGAPPWLHGYAHELGLFSL